LLSLTLDPARDTPETLTAYAQTHGADPQTWTFATGEAALMTDGLPSMFNVLSLPDSDGTLDHTIKLALLDPSGRQIAEWKDNAVTADDVFAAMVPSP
jgi:cytochrome oxidase Cu insertion factor (SCO1/SenC/PrrC family)